jgi:hypothetical protein
VYVCMYVHACGQFFHLSLSPRGELCLYVGIMYVGYKIFAS